jgi:hypothetical protein
MDKSAYLTVSVMTDGFIRVEWGPATDDQTLWAAWKRIKHYAQAITEAGWVPPKDNG